MNKINKIHNDIYEIVDFISKKEQDDILNIINNLKEPDWFVNDSNYLTDFWLGKTFFINNDLTNIINNRINSLFSSVKEITSIGSINRHKINDSMGAHFDHWIKDADYYVKYGAVLYYNDDYEGGEIEYPEIGIVIKPKARSLIIHGGEILHGTLPVLNGNFRYFSTCFIKGTKEIPVILNKNIFKEQFDV
jgi:hypothetical protein